MPPVGRTGLFYFQLLQHGPLFVYRHIATVAGPNKYAIWKQPLPEAVDNSGIKIVNAVTQNTRIKHSPWMPHSEVCHVKRMAWKQPAGHFDCAGAYIHTRIVDVAQIRYNISGAAAYIQNRAGTIIFNEASLQRILTNFACMRQLLWPTVLPILVGLAWRNQFNLPWLWHRNVSRCRKCVHRVCTRNVARHFPYPKPLCPAARYAE